MRYEMKSVRLALVVFGTIGLGACGFLPPSQQQEFAVSAAAPSQGVFRNADAGLNDNQAANLCALGYDKLNEATLPADPGSLEVWRVRCQPYPIWYETLF